jgi:hypothetical protein
VVIWDNLNTHVSHAMTDLVAARDWLIKTRLRRMQYRPGLLNGFLAGPKLDLTPFCNPGN